MSLPAGEGAVASVAVRSVKSPRVFLSLKRGLKRFHAASHAAGRQQPADADWHAMLQRLDDEGQARDRLKAAEAALNRLGRS